MARICNLCGRGASVANIRSKSNIATKRLQKPNLHKLRIGGLSILSCTRCKRTMNKSPQTGKQSA
ncbi:50S ribosomal protein L28 [bacterium]|nr:50S ribosomal protein L28 [bacterium]MDP6571286.1 L28 family ribosomal protein [Patescibacteria group bacterium]MDP6756118.1 L28 family ribosomal protein [Patescibacteria group bacterium]